MSKRNNPVDIKILKRNFTRISSVTLTCLYKFLNQKKETKLSSFSSFTTEKRMKLCSLKHTDDGPTSQVNCPFYHTVEQLLDILKIFNFFPSESSWDLVRQNILKTEKKLCFECNEIRLHKLFFIDILKHTHDFSSNPSLYFLVKCISCSTYYLHRL
jgi:hypothetical protein